MQFSPKILAFAGSLREGSLNKKLARVAADGARAAGAEATFLDLRDYPLPVYDADIEAAEGLPENVLALKRILSDHDGFLIACPEYNSSITGALKNFIDWTSRKDGDTPGLAPVRGKVAGLLSASPGALGGLRGLFHVREILQNIGIIVVPKHKALPRAKTLFDDEGRLTDEDQRKAVYDVAEYVVSVAMKLHGPAGD